MVAFLKKLRTAEGGDESTEEQMQAQNLWYLRKESMIESSKRSSMMTTGAEGDSDRCVVGGPKLGTSGRMIERPAARWCMTV